MEKRNTGQKTNLGLYTVGPGVYSSSNRKEYQKDKNNNVSGE
jgi:hypothetical protein